MAGPTRSESSRKDFLPLLRFIATLLFLVAMGFAQSAQDLLQQAEAALGKEDYAAAAKLLETHLAQNPADYRAEFNLAYAYSLTGRSAEAIQHYKNVLLREPELISAHRNLGILLLEQGAASEAEEHLRRVVEKQPSDVTATFCWAEALSALKRSQEARQAYEQVLRLDPNHAAAHFGEARLMVESEPAEAEKHLRSALQTNPSLEEARLFLAAALEARASGDPALLDEAAELYRQSLKIHPDRNDVRLRLGQIYVARKQFEAAVEQFEAARAAGDSSPEMRQELLQAYLQTPGSGREKAIALLQEILARDESNAEMRLLSGRLQMEKKQYREAAEQFQQAAQLRPDWAEAFTNLASALYLLKDYRGTVAALDKVAELKQDTAGTYFLRAITLDKLRVWQPALENYQRFLQASEGKNPDQEFQARQRIRILSREIRRR